MNFSKEFFVGIRETNTHSDFTVTQNYPNPASHSTRFEIRIEKPANVSVRILNLLGKRLKRIDMGKMNPGINVITLDVSGLPKGMYTYCVEVDGQRSTRKMMVQ